MTLDIRSFAILPRTDGFVPPMDAIVEAAKKAKTQYWRDGQTPDLASTFSYVGEAGTLFMTCSPDDFAEAVGFACTLVGHLRGIIFQMETFMQENDEETPVCEECGIRHGDPDEFFTAIKEGVANVETAFVTFRWAVGDPIEFKSVVWRLADNGEPVYGEELTHVPQGYIPSVIEAAIESLVG